MPDCSSLPDAFHPSRVGLATSGPQLLVSVAIAFVVGYAAIAWLLKFVSTIRSTGSACIRVALGVVLLILLGTGVVASGPLPAA